jgi:hypothetical protein
MLMYWNARLLHMLLSIAIAWLLPATTAQAQYRQDGHNDEQISTSGHYNVSAVGFYYTPATSYWLNRVETYFSTAAYYDGCCGLSVERTVTLEILSAPRSDGGTLLRSAMFNSLDASGQYGGPTFSPMYMIGGTTYFIGFLNVLALGANLTFEASTPHQVFRFDWPEPFGATGQYVETQNLFDQAVPNIGPLLRFSGPPAWGRPDPATVPEPPTLPLLALGALVFFRKRNSRLLLRAVALGSAGGARLMRELHGGVT